MSRIKRLLDEENYEAYLQDMVFEYADQWEESFLKLLNEDTPVIIRDKEQSENLPF